jgi:hypothetical protein
MHVTDDPNDRVAVIQMNAELQRAQVELSRMQFAIGKLLSRFSTEDIARNARPEIIHSALEVLQSLKSFYSALKDQQPGTTGTLKPGINPLSEEYTLYAVRRASEYIREQRDYYFALGKELAAEHKLKMARFFSADLLDSVRVVQMIGCRVDNPPFYAEAKALGFPALPEFKHKASLTFNDAVVFNEKPTDRILFHALVHAAQYRVLGLDQYTELFVRSFLRVNSFVLVPLEAHAFALGSKFAANDARGFSVEEEVTTWAVEGRY